MTRFRRLIGDRSGYTLVEVMVVLSILGFIVAGLTTALMQGTRAELDTNNRVQAQIQANLAFDKLRKDLHCATTVTVYGSGSGVAFSPACGPQPQVAWCTAASGGQFILYRVPGATNCNSPTSGKRYSQNLTSSAVFTYTPAASGVSLAKVHADVRVNVNAGKATSSPGDIFEIADDIVLRNTTR